MNPLNKTISFGELVQISTGGLIVFWGQILGVSVGVTGVAVIPEILSAVFGDVQADTIAAKRKVNIMNRKSAIEDIIEIPFYYFKVIGRN